MDYYIFPELSMALMEGEDGQSDCCQETASVHSCDNLDMEPSRNCLLSNCEHLDECEKSQMMNSHTSAKAAFSTFFPK